MKSFLAIGEKAAKEAYLKMRKTIRPKVIFPNWAALSDEVWNYAPSEEEGYVAHGQRVISHGFRLVGGSFTIARPNDLSYVRICYRYVGDGLKKGIIYTDKELDAMAVRVTSVTDGSDF